jgi:hypothetical protein
LRARERRARKTLTQRADSQFCDNDAAPQSRWFVERSK